MIHISLDLIGWFDGV